MRDLSDEQLEHTTFFISTLAVPAAAPRSAAAQLGRVLFDEFACAGCHTPTVTTGAHPIPQLANQTIHPYTDLLLHDVGDLLTDGRSDFAATGVEWRTPPLWGIGLVQLVEPARRSCTTDARAPRRGDPVARRGGRGGAGSLPDRSPERSGCVDRVPRVSVSVTIAS